jgi:hypothetical protein
MKMLAALAALAWMAQQAPVPGPFPKPGSSWSATPQTASAQAPASTQQAPQAQPAAAQPGQAPTPAVLGLPVYPNAKFIASYDAGRGQRFYLYGSTATFEMLVSYYRTMLKQHGDEVFDSPATYEFDVGKFREDDMAFPPGVTIKDFQSSLSAGYPNPDPAGQPKAFPTIIQIVPLPMDQRQ